MTSQTHRFHFGVCVLESKSNSRNMDELKKKKKKTFTKCILKHARVFCIF